MNKFKYLQCLNFDEKFTLMYTIGFDKVKTNGVNFLAYTLLKRQGISWENKTHCDNKSKQITATAAGVVHTYIYERK